MNLHTGSCLCGEVKYKLNSEIMKVVNCHCNFCRSHSGAAFSSYAALPFAALELTKGQEILSAYKFGEGEKHFCRECGTPIFNINNKYLGACMVYLGTLEKAQNVTPMVNVWNESKLGWVDEVSAIHSLDQGVESTRKA